MRILTVRFHDGDLEVVVTSDEEAYALVAHYEAMPGFIDYEVS